MPCSAFLNTPTHNYTVAHKLKPLSSQRVHARLILDLDNTLVDTRSFAKQARLRALAALKEQAKVELNTLKRELSYKHRSDDIDALNNILSSSLDELLESFMEVVRAKGSNYGRHFNDFLLKKPHLILNDDVRIALETAAFMAYRDLKNKEYPTYLFPDAKNFLDNFSSFPLYIASRGVETKQMEKLLRLGIKERFSRIFITTQKNSEFYNYIREELNPLKGPLVMIGDNKEEDWALPASLGFAAVLVDRNDRELVRPEVQGNMARVSSLSQVTEELLSKLIMAIPFQQLRGGRLDTSRFLTGARAQKPSLLEMPTRLRA